MSLAGLCAAVALTLGQCPGGICPVPQRPAVKKADYSKAEYRWVQGKGDVAHEFYLFKGSLQVGGYDSKKAIYRGYDAFRQKWGPSGAIPSAAPSKCLCGECGCVPCTCEPEAKSIQTQEIRPNYGVLLDKVKESDSRYSHNGEEVSKKTAHELVTGQLTDDSGKLWVTVIGPPVCREPVEKAMALLPADLYGAFSVKSYDSSHWAVKSAGFVTSGSPTVYCQAPGGKVLHRQDDFDGGQDELFKALRKAKGNYDSKKDPDLRRVFPDLFPHIDLKKAAPGLLLGACVIGVIGFNIAKRRK